MPVSSYKIIMEISKDNLSLLWRYTFTPIFDKYKTQKSSLLYEEDQGEQIGYRSLHGIEWMR